MKRISAVTAVLAAFIVLCFAGTAYAQENWVSVQLDYNLYGHVWNTDTGAFGGLGVPYCAPTATINSFRFLEKSNPLIYGTTLTGGDANIVASRNALAVQMNTIINAGTTDKDWWEGKVDWIEARKPGITIYSGMVTPGVNFALWKYNQWLTNAYPTWDWLWTQLNNKEDVELKINPGSETAHALTLTSLKFNDLDSDGIWDLLEPRKIDYLDPNNPTQLFESDLFLNEFGALKFNWHNNGFNNPTDVFISMAFRESVPEPSTIIVLACGLVSLFGQRRRRV